MQETPAMEESSLTCNDYRAKLRLSSGKWRVELIDTRKVTHHLGLFDTLAEAKAAYLSKADELSKTNGAPSMRNMRDMDLYEFIEALGIIDKPS